MTSRLSSITSPPPALILAAGESRRFWPLSATRHKTLFEIGDSSLLERTVMSLAHVGVPSILILQSPRSLYSTLGYGTLPSDCINSRYGSTEVQFLEQPEARGQGDAILRGAAHLGEHFLMVQPENINAGEIVLEILRTPENDDIAVVAAKERSDFSLYAAIENKGKRLRTIIEKPREWPTPRPLCGIGMYLIDKTFLPILQSYEPDPTSLILALDHAAKADQVSVVSSRHEFLPLKYPSHLWAYISFLGLATPSESRNANVAARANGTYLGRSFISRGCIIGNDVTLSNAILAPHVSIGSGTKIDQYAEELDGEEQDSIVIGEGATIGTGVTVMPGVRIGAGASVASGLTVTSDVPDLTKVQ